MNEKLTIDFGKGVVLDTTTPTKAMDRPLKITIDNLITKKCPHRVQVDKQWSPTWNEYVHCHSYNYSITINTDPKAGWYQKISKQDRTDDHVIIQQIRDMEEAKLKTLISKALGEKVIKNITIIYEYGDNGKRHYHMLVLTNRKNLFKMMIEKEFEMSMEAQGAGWKKRDPINLIRPKKMKKCFDYRSACMKAAEVVEAIDYIIYTYYQKENLGENLLLNIIRKL